MEPNEHTTQDKPKLTDPNAALVYYTITSYFNNLHFRITAPGRSHQSFLYLHEYFRQCLQHMKSQQEQRYQHHKLCSHIKYFDMNL
jgi:hypothetical protein